MTVNADMLTARLRTIKTDLANRAKLLAPVAQRRARNDTEALGMAIQIINEHTHVADKEHRY